MHTTYYYDVESSLGFLTITTNRLMSACFRKRLSEAGVDLTAEQWGVLAQLWNRGFIAQDELAHILCVDKSSLSRVLDVMERRELVYRKRDSGDARRNILYATDKAEAFRDICRTVAETTLQEMLGDLSSDDVAVCGKVLARIKQNIREITE